MARPASNRLRRAATFGGVSGPGARLSVVDVRLSETPKIFACGEGPP